MNEAYLQGRLMDACRATMPHCEPLNNHGSRFTKDRPDMTNSWLKTTSWWELKFYDNEPFKSSPTQEILCKKLAQQSICYYVIYELRRGVKRTCIVHPDSFETWWECKDHVVGFSHNWVAAFIRRTHEHHRESR